MHSSFTTVENFIRYSGRFCATP